MTNAPNKSVIAAFDFDGTLTTKDTSLPFVLFVLGRWKGWRKILFLVPLFGVDLLLAVWRERFASKKNGHVLGGIRGRWENNVHERVLRHCFSGMDGDELRRTGGRFAQLEMAKFLRPAGLERLSWHKAQGHCCVLISGSVDAYLDPWGKRVGFDHVLVTELETDASGVVTGRFSTEPCWGRAKVRRLLHQFGPREGYTLYVYGDSAGDRDLIAIADHGFLVRDDFELVEA
ncbi:MAG: HAD-IB family hydrolase [Gemmatimonadetes bacterium]|nr:MAG: HAD-IB family hydrolase [Gemmatimonadota bacterium]